MDDPIVPPPPATAASAAPPPLPWEDPSIGAVEGWFDTVRLFIGQPQEAFHRMSATGIGRPYLYALIAAWIEMAVGFAYWLLLQAPFVLMGLPQLEDELTEAAIGTGMILLIAAGIFVLMPLFVIVFMFLHTCILHLMLLILGEGRRGFETTFRLLCYSHTADLANVIPLCGGLIGLVWFVVLQIVGIAEAHRCSYGKAALAVFLPILLCCGCVAVLISMGVGAGILSALADR